MRCEVVPNLTAPRRHVQDPRRRQGFLFPQPQATVGTTSTAPPGSSLSSPGSGFASVRALEASAQRRLLTAVDEAVVGCTGAGRSVRLQCWLKMNDSALEQMEI